MTTEDIIIHIFCRVDEQLPPLMKHSQVKLYPSELVTIGVLYAVSSPSSTATHRTHLPDLSGTQPPTGRQKRTGQGSLERGPQVVLAAQRGGSGRRLGR